MTIDFLHPILAADIDGTFLDLGNVPGRPPQFNRALALQLQGKNIHLISNQALAALRSDRHLSRWHDRFMFLLNNLSRYNVGVLSIRLSLYQPRVEAAQIEAAYDLLSEPSRNLGVPIYTYTTPQFRKPNAGMLKVVSADLYYGDSDEDAQAAAAARILFLRVERFTGAAVPAIPKELAVYGDSLQ